MESGEPKEKVSNQRMYSELEKAILDIKTLADSNEKIRHNKRVYKLLSPRNITKNYIIKSYENDAATVRFDEAGLYEGEEYKKKGKGSKDRIIINKFWFRDSDDLQNDLYMNISHELSHALIGEHKIHRNCNSDDNVLNHCFHFFDYLAMFGKEALPKAYCYATVGAADKTHEEGENLPIVEEEFSSLLEDSYSTYRASENLPDNYPGDEEVMKLVDSDGGFRDFLKSNIIMLNLDKLNELEKKFVEKAVGYGAMKASFYMNGQRIVNADYSVK